MEVQVDPDACKVTSLPLLVPSDELDDDPPLVVDLLYLLGLNNSKTWF